MPSVAGTGSSRIRDRRLHDAHVAMAGLAEELLSAESEISDVMSYVASTPMLFAARHRVQQESKQVRISEADLRHVQRLLRQGKYRPHHSWWKEGDEEGKPYLRQDPLDRMITFALFWTLAPAWTAVRHGSVYGSAKGTPIGPHGRYAYAPGRGIFDAIDTLRRPTCSRPEGPRDGFVVIVDASRAFEHIRHDMVLKHLETRITDQYALDLVANYLHRIRTDVGVGVGRGGAFGTLLADVAFSHIDGCWPEIGVRHRVQLCYLHPWRNQPKPKRAPDKWMLDFFAQISPQRRLDTPAVQPIHRVDNSSDELLTRDLRPDGDPVSVTRDGNDAMCPFTGPTRLDTGICGSGPSSLIYLRYGDDLLVAGGGGPERAAWVQEVSAAPAVGPTSGWR